MTSFEDMFKFRKKNNLASVKKKQISIDLSFDLLIRAFFGRGELAVCHSLLYILVSLKNSWFITCDHTTKEILLNDDYVKKNKKLVFSIDLSSVADMLKTIPVEDFQRF